MDGGHGAGDPTPAASYPQTFDLHSIAPSPITPANNATVSTQPTFRWSPVTGAYQYKLYVSTDPSFGTLMPGSPFLTAGTSFTASNFPASAHLYWKVQALDRSGNGLAYSATQQFQKTLAVPTFATVTNPTSGDGIPVLQWDPMPGAIGYDVHVNLPSNGSGQTDFTIDSTAFVPISMTGTGVFTWSVRAEYPTAGQPAVSAYSAPQTFTRTIQPPQHPTTTMTGVHQVVVSWDPKNTAKSYTVQFATDSGFGSSVFDTVADTENTAFAPILTAGQYIEGGPVYWRVAAKDADGNQGAWTAAQTLTLPQLLHMSYTGTVTRNKSTTIKVFAKSGANKPIAGVNVKVSGCGSRPRRSRPAARAAPSSRSSRPARG